jgi:sugar O-acyltransferase (sialic acid O-acetyltransferase NeuD family)
MRRIAIIGAGGFARELCWLLSEIAADPSRRYEPFDVAGFLVSDRGKLGSHDSDVLGEFDWLDDNRVDALAMGIGTPDARLRVANELKQRFPAIEWPAIVHPSVRFDAKSCKVEEGVILCAGVIATVNVVFEEFSMVDILSTIGHEARIGAGSAIYRSANISGGDEIGKGVLVGTGAQILQYLIVGDRAIVGAGSVVTKDVAPMTTVAGIPAKPLIWSAEK